MGHLLLCFYINGYTGLEFHREVVIIHSNLVDQPSDEGFVKLGDLCGLRGDEVLQFLDPLQVFLFHLRIHQGLLLLVAQPEDLVGDGIVILLVVRFLDELLLQLLKAFVDAFRGEGARAYDSLRDIFLYLLDEGIAVFAKPLDRFQ